MRALTRILLTASLWVYGGLLAFANTAEPEVLANAIDEWKRDAQVALTKANDPAAADLLPEGVRASALGLRRRDLEQTLLAISRLEKAESATAEFQRAADAAAMANEEWIRFEDPPPYSILRLDQLQNQRDAIDEKKASLESSLAILERAMDNLFSEEEAAAENLRRRNTESIRTGEAGAWLAESARFHLRQLQSRKLALTATLKNLHLQLRSSTSELALLDRQIHIVERGISFTDDDFEAILEASRQRQKALGDELAAIHKRQRTAATEREKAIKARDAALAANTESATTPATALAVVRVEAAETASDSLQLIAEAIEWLLQIEAYHIAAQEDRRILMTRSDRAELTDAEDAIGVIIDRLKAWEIVSSNELSAVAADLSNNEARVAALPEGDPRLPLLNEQRAILVERQAAVQRVVRAVNSQRNQFSRWLQSHQSRDRNFGERISDYWHRLVHYLRSLVAIEIFQYQKGEGEGSERSVTLGNLFTALLLFFIPYIIAHFVVRRIKRTTVSMRLIGEAQANTLANWLAIFIAFILALFALNFLDIPLTVFAFLGGALVIGLGFGMQTLIKNFISGIILLFERRVRVGDILEVDGTIGTVTEINTRSSVIRSADGLEIMMPNSLFLENRVTNLTLTNRCNRRVIRVGVAYGTTPGTVMGAMRECADRHGLVLKDPEPLVLFEDFGDSALMFALYFWIEFNDRTNALMVASDLRIMIEKRFSELGIQIPFPQRDVHLHTVAPTTPATPPAEPPLP